MHHHQEKHKATSPHRPASRYHREIIRSTEHIPYGPHEVRTLLAWSAPSRPFVKRQKAYYINLLLLMLTIEVILFLFSQYLLMLVVMSLAFVSFAFANTPPGNFTYHISTEGLAIEDHFYLWQELYDFYFKKRNGVDILHVRTKAYLPGELIITLGDVPTADVRDTMLPFLPYREVVRTTFTEQAGEWLARTFPLDDSFKE